MIGELSSLSPLVRGPVDIFPVRNATGLIHLARCLLRNSENKFLAGARKTARQETVRGRKKIFYKRRRKKSIKQMDLKEITERSQREIS
jgi:hypothetical protein